MRYIVIMCFGIWILSGCENVIDLDLNESEPRLVIEGTILEEQDGSASAKVKLSTTAPFFESNIPTINNATVTITSENGNVVVLNNTTNGIYATENFDLDPILKYTLEVIYQEETFSATESLQTGVPLEFVTQENEGGFNNDSIELKAFFTDPANIDNYYLFEGISSKGNVVDTFSDEFFDGNQIFGFYFVEDLAPGDQVFFNLYGVNEQFYNYMFTLLQQSTDQSDGPFETQPATVRGNIVNLTNGDNYPLGYFRISQVSSLSYIVE